MDAIIKYFFDTYETTTTVEDNATIEPDDLFLQDYPENSLGIDNYDEN